MKASEAMRLLALCAGFDGRQIDDSMALAWANIMPEWMRFEDAVGAVEEHYRRDRRRVMPADIIESVRRIRDARLEDADRTFVPNAELADDAWASLEAYREHRRRVADGEVFPDPVIALPARDVKAAIEGTFRSVDYVPPPTRLCPCGQPVAPGARYCPEHDDRVLPTVACKFCDKVGHVGWTKDRTVPNEHGEPVNVNRMDDPPAGMLQCAVCDGWWLPYARR